MQDLNVIQRQNANAIAQNIPELRASGHWVVVEKAGLHVLGAEIFSGDTTAGSAEKRARAKLAELNAIGGTTHGEILAPTNLNTVAADEADDLDPLFGKASVPASVHHAINADHLAERFGVAA